jgi:hypothetical protein
MIGSTAVAHEVRVSYSGWVDAPPTDLAYSRAGSGLLIAGDSLVRISAAQLQSALLTAGDRFVLDVLGTGLDVVLPTALRALSAPARSPLVAGVGEDDELVLFDLIGREITATRAPRLPGNAVVEVHVSPRGDAVVFLEEIDRDDEPLLLHQWFLFSPGTGTERAVLGEPAVRPFECLGWLSDRAVAFKAEDGTVWLLELGAPAPRPVLAARHGAAVEGALAASASPVFALATGGEHPGIYLFDVAALFSKPGRPVLAAAASALAFGPGDETLFAALRRDDGTAAHGLLSLPQAEFRALAVFDEDAAAAAVWDGDFFAIARIEDDGLILSLPPWAPLSPTAPPSPAEPDPAQR